MSPSGGAQPPAQEASRGLVREFALPALAGAACVLGFAPFYLWPAPVAALAVLFHAWSRSATPGRAALSGFAFGLGLFLAGVSWVYVAMNVYGAMAAPLAAIATFAFCAYLAMFPALAGAFLVFLVREAGPRRLLAAPGLFVLAEILRGWLFTGFSWLTLGTSQVPSSPLAGFAPLLGAYGVSLALAAVTSLLAAAVTGSPSRKMRTTALAASVGLFAVGALLAVVEWTSPSGPPVSVALVQGNVEQQLKFRPDYRERTFNDYRRAIIEAKAQLVILPETALPALIDHLPPGYLDGLRAHGREAGKEIFIGAIEREKAGSEYRYFNSLVKVGEGAPASYRKRHLVPFGEFTPPGFQWVLGILRIPLNDLSRGEAGQPPLRAAGLVLGVAVCYEDIFGEEVIDQLPEASALVNISNDAWYGRSLAADQHLQASQMRALETGRWMVRATNTGVTAAIDERGRVASLLPQFAAATLTERVTPRAGSTPYVRWGNAAAILLAVVSVLAALRRASR